MDRANCVSFEASGPRHTSARRIRQPRVHALRSALAAATAALAFIVPYGAPAVAADAKAATAPQHAAATDATKLPAGLRPWKGDWDGIVKRRTMRVLVVPSRTFYFVDKGTQRGISYDVFRGFEDEINRKQKTKALKFHVTFIPVPRDELIPALRNGRGDVAAANLTITEAREKLVDFSGPLMTGVRELVVTGPQSPALKTLDDLSGQEVYVRKSSSYFEHLEALNARFVAAGRKPVKLTLASENLEDEDLLEMLNAGLVPAIVVDSHKASFWTQVFPKIVVHDDVSVHEGDDIAWAFRENSPQLKAVLDDFIRTHGKGTLFGNTLLKRYLQNAKYVKDATTPDELRKFEQTVALFRKYAEQYDLDYLLMMAQGYQESRLDQSAKSQVGAIGVMQVMPATGKDLKVGDIAQIEPNIHAGVKYIRFMIDNYYEKEPMDRLDKGLFAFASYNAGPGRIQSLRAEAAKRGLDPNRWFKQVELVVAEKVGQETVTYVANIYKYYIAYKLLTEAEAEKRQAREALQKGKVP
jgi:membrane-bound lytic murein transglycosylase MltF